jgi:hypothetical protein
MISSPICLENLVDLNLHMDEARKHCFEREQSLHEALVLISRSGIVLLKLDHSTSIPLAEQ